MFAMEHCPSPLRIFINVLSFASIGGGGVAASCSSSERWPLTNGWLICAAGDEEEAETEPLEAVPSMARATYLER